MKNAANRELVQKSKLLSRILRHRPDSIGLKLDKQGWCDVAELLKKLADAGTPISDDELQEIIATSDKQRFSLNCDRTRIRAAQGHSITVDLKLRVKTPPPVLYHGTVEKFLPSIRKHGLLPGSRHDVHLSADRKTAEAVGARRGQPIVLVIETYALVKAGVEFKESDNGVWLVGAIPAQNIRFPST